jgi:hypothetical protein
MRTSAPAWTSLREVVLLQRATWPKNGMGRALRPGSDLDHPIRPHQRRLRDREPQRLSGHEVGHELCTSWAAHPGDPQLLAPLSILST